MQLSGSGGKTRPQYAARQMVGDEVPSAAALWDQKGWPRPGTHSLKAARGLTCVLPRIVHRGPGSPYSLLRGWHKAWKMCLPLLSSPKVTGQPQATFKGFGSSPLVLLFESKIRGESTSNESIHLHIPTGNTNQSVWQGMFWSPLMTTPLKSMQLICSNGIYHSK